MHNPGSYSNGSIWFIKLRYDLEIYALVDLIHKDLIIPYNWTLNGNPFRKLKGWNYVKTRLKEGGQLYLHRLIMSAKGEQLVDHINRNPLDCRKSCNLRFTTFLSNSMNRDQSLVGNRHIKFKGIYKHGINRGYVGQLSGRYLGTFKTQEEAALIYNEEAEKLDDFAFLNRIDELNHNVFFDCHISQY